MASFTISDKELDCAALAAGMADHAGHAAGGFVAFEGWVRDSNEGHAVTALEYEVFHELAISEGEKVLAEAVEKFGLVDARAVHREGSLAIGDCAVWIGVTARHRGEAFAGCRYIIDEIKHRLPVWKKEHYAGLEPQWVNCQHAHHHAPAPIQAIDYYARQMRLPEVGQAGQQRLTAARILVIGVGGLGSAAATALAASGIGTIGLAEPDVLQASNLHRQTIYDAADIGKPKSGLAAARLRALNPLIEVHVHQEKVTADNVEGLFGAYDIVLDCTDNFIAKYLLSDAALLYGKPVVQASIYKFEGQLLTIDPAGQGGCLRCLWPEPPAAGLVGDCAETGVLGTVPALFGTLQANEAIKRVIGLATPDALTIFDMLSLQSQSIPRTRNPECPVCHPCAGRDPVANEGLQAPPDPCLRRDDNVRRDDEIDIVINAADTDETLRARYTLIDVREDWELQAWPLPGALHMPTSAFDLDALTAPHDAPLLLVCAKGVRSRAAAEYLRRQGWRNAFNLVGGIASFPVRNKDEAKRA